MRYGLYRGRKVPLDKPMYARKAKKKFKVYTMHNKKVRIVRFGSRDYKIKKYMPKNKKSYCRRSEGIKSSKPVKLQPNYWSRKFGWECQ